MTLKEEIKKCINLAGGFVIMLTAGGGYIEGVTAVENFNDEKITLLTKGGKVIIEGEGLTLAKLIEGDVAVNGKIKNVGVQK